MSNRYVVTKSKIDGLGVVATTYLVKREHVGLVMFLPSQVPQFVKPFVCGLPVEGIHFVVTLHLGRWLNHSSTPNCELLNFPLTHWQLRTKRVVKPGEELTIDYRYTPWWIAKPATDWKK